MRLLDVMVATITLHVSSAGDMFRFAGLRI